MSATAIHRAALQSFATVAIVLGPSLHAEQAGTSVQYRSPTGVEYRSLPDTDAVKAARAVHDADPKNIAKIVELGVAQSGARQFREAIATFSKGLAIEPNNALLLRWRGHRHLSVREFDRAFDDLSRGSTLDPSIYGNWYHLGIVQFLRGRFDDAAASFAKALPIAPDPGELAGSNDWLWMSLSRAGRGADAKALLDRRSDTKPEFKPLVNAYTRRLQLYRGEIGPDAVVTAADTDDTQIATLAYGLGNWYLVRGDQVQARKWFERSVQAAGGWPGFGFIVSEEELKRLTPQPGAKDAQAALAHPDFSGQWTVEASLKPLSTGAPAGRPDQGVLALGDMGSGWGSSLTITQDVRQMIVEERVFSSYDAAQQPRSVYAFDGSETKNAIMISHTTQVRASRAQWDGQALRITTLYPGTDAATGKPMTTEVRYCLTRESPDTLVIEAARGSGGVTRAVYRRGGK